MEITLPTDCGNSPRLLIVGEFAVRWAAGDADALAAWLADDARWILVGAATAGDPAVSRVPPPPFTPESIGILSTVTHGRLAACDGYLSTVDRRVDFCHMIRFAGAARTAKIVEIRTYMAPDTP